MFRSFKDLFEIRTLVLKHNKRAGGEVAVKLILHLPANNMKKSLAYIPNDLLKIYESNRHAI